MVLRTSRVKYILYVGVSLYYHESALIFLKVSPWMDNGTAVSFVQRCPSADRLKMLTEIATGKVLSIIVFV